MGYHLKYAYTKYVLHYNSNLFTHQVNTCVDHLTPIYIYIYIDVLLGNLREVCHPFDLEMLIWTDSQIN